MLEHDIDPWHPGIADEVRSLAEAHREIIPPELYRDAVECSRRHLRISAMVAFPRKPEPPPKMVDSNAKPKESFGWRLTHRGEAERSQRRRLTLIRGCILAILAVPETDAPPTKVATGLGSRIRRDR